MTEHILENFVIHCGHCQNKKFEVELSNGITGNTRTVILKCVNCHQLVRFETPGKVSVKKIEADEVHVDV